MKRHAVAPFSCTLLLGVQLWREGDEWSQPPCAFGEVLRLGSEGPKTFEKRGARVIRAHPRLLVARLAASGTGEFACGIHAPREAHDEIAFRDWLVEPEERILKWPPSLFLGEASAKAVSNLADGGRVARERPMARQILS